MKLLVISLALATLAGSQAFVIRSAPDAHDSSELSHFLDEIEHFMEAVENNTDHNWELFKKSETGKILVKWFEEDDPTEAPAEGQAPKEEESFAEGVVDLVASILDLAEKAMEEIDKQTPSLLKKFKKELVSAVGHRLDPLVHRLRPHVVPMMKEALSKHEAFNPEMEKEFQKQLDALDKVAPQYLHKVSEYVSKL